LNNRRREKCGNSEENGDRCAHTNPEEPDGPWPDEKKVRWGKRAKKKKHGKRKKSRGKANSLIC